MTMIGRAAINDIVLAEPGVSRQHAGIRADAEGFWIADLGSRNGTFVNGERIGVDPHRLQNFDRIDLGGGAAAVHWIFMESQDTVNIPRPD
jgi:pSer/pThr/pTyr-binding forkhead associated (FHA) protein